jgi:hypothetical protein
MIVEVGKSGLLTGGGGRRVRAWRFFLAGGGRGSVTKLTRTTPFISTTLLLLEKFTRERMHGDISICFV